MHQGRTAGEFVLIVVGVLVALMLETAIGKRDDDKLRDEYLLRISTDIELDSKALQSRIEFFSAVRDLVSQFMQDKRNRL